MRVAVAGPLRGQISEPPFLPPKEQAGQGLGSLSGTHLATCCCVWMMQGEKKKSRTAIGLCAVKIRDTGPVYVRVASPWPLGWRRGGLGAVPLRWRALYGLGMYEWTPQSHACTSSNEMYTCSREGGEIKLSAASHRAEVGFCLRMHLPPSCLRPSGL